MNLPGSTGPSSIRDRRRNPLQPDLRTEEEKDDSGLELGRDRFPSVSIVFVHVTNLDVYHALGVRAAWGRQLPADASEAAHVGQRILRGASLLPNPHWR